MPIVQALDSTWLFSPKVRPSIYLCEVGNEFPTIGRPPKANQVAQMKEFPTQPVSLYPFMYPPKRPKLDSELLLCCWSSHFLSYVSLTLIFPTPFLTPSTPIYRLPLVELSWWWAGFLGGWALLGYIPDQIGPTSQDKCDCLETCTCCQLVLGRQFPLRHYHYQTVKSLIGS